ncbi:hypothetical protein [Marinobacterium jannaschii]|uniref:hypothetical protein n=1 Tax=Marinobacterium jannaschii TaxID=64970 RepID=UPI0012EC80BF|nr:hypothetical protein [Marinobacterium jannaschii]
MRKILTIVLLSMFSNIALCQSVLDTGEFAVVHVDGHVTNKVFRVINQDDKWRVEDKKDNGKWEDVTCEVDCILSKSKPEHIAEFFHNQFPQNTEIECVHNQAFAFCSLLKNSAKTSVLVAFTPQAPIHVKLKKISME